MILGMIWTLILRFEIQDISEEGCAKLLSSDPLSTLLSVLLPASYSACYVKFYVGSFTDFFFVDIKWFVL